MRTGMDLCMTKVNVIETITASLELILKNYLHHNGFIFRVAGTCKAESNSLSGQTWLLHTPA
jgi:hypothetical protein